MTDSVDRTRSLICLSRAGDMEAFDELLRRYREKVRVAARQKIKTSSKLKSLVDSEDLVQSVLIKALKNFDDFSYRGEASFLQYLVKILTNTVRDKVDYIDAKKRPPPSRRESLSRCEETPPANYRDATTPSQAVILNEEKDVLQKALDELPDDQRKAVVHCRLEGLELSEAAEIMSRSPDAVRMLAVRGLTRLTALLSKTADNE